LPPAFFAWLRWPLFTGKTAMRPSARPSAWHPRRSEPRLPCIPGTQR
jgi:hypothetical protein